MNRDTRHETRGTIKSFTDLNAWCESHAMVTVEGFGQLMVARGSGIINATKGRDS